MGIFGCALEKLAWVRAESPFVCGGDSEGVAPRPARVASWATHRLPVALERVLLLLDELEHAVNELPGAKCQLRVLLQDLEMLAIQPAADAAAPHCDGEKLLRLSAAVLHYKRVHQRCAGAHAMCGEVGDVVHGGRRLLTGYTCA
eukprot:gnl/TRDRNA2_/TRDRNA2_159263_c0_seq1.p2 gnl/TRDRNA2_/TRDRNA2_159263_c0~~gnl/TRDRNA2_/TRDRNA2_159263_c0_seq1.p2  ORF type:complete len:145 (-),score=30.55 gnl/TRDRNA2_/TRDRNA2_159263_c0_seq1:671-1105(-)